MTEEFDNELRQLFTDAHVELPAEDFTAEAMARLRRQVRRERFIWSSSAAAALAFLWLLFSNFDSALRIVTVFPSTFLDVAAESLVALSNSPLFYVYGVALGGYLLLTFLSRRRIRLM